MPDIRKVQLYSPNGQFSGEYQDADSLGLVAGTKIKPMPAANYTLTDADHGFILDFAGLATVTVPAGLRSDFAAGISQGGASQVTISAGADVTINEPDARLKTEKRYALVSIMAFGTNSYRLFGRTAA